MRSQNQILLPDRLHQHPNHNQTRSNRLFKLAFETIEIGIGHGDRGFAPGLVLSSFLLVSFSEPVVTVSQRLCAERAVNSISSDMDRARSPEDIVG